MQCIDQAYWGIFPHFEVTRFLSDSFRDSSETCFYFWDYHIPHHFGYSFEIRFGVSSLRHWSIHHSDFLADYCWAEDSWLMMLDSSFGCASYIHTGAYSPPSSEILICYCIRYEDGWSLLVCSPHDFDIRLSTLGHIPLSLMRLYLGSDMRMDDGWSLLVCLPHDFDIRYPYWGIFPSPLWDLFGQWYEDGWLVSVV